MRRKVALLGFFLAVATLLSGCGKQDEELENYKKSMETFFSNVDILNDSINSIDPYAEDASEKLLKQLDLFETSIDQMAALSVPEQFEGVEQLADEAAENMHEAVALFHQAYEGESYQQNLADAAYQYYERVNVRLKYIVQILHGELAEEE